MNMKKIVDWFDPNAAYRQWRKSLPAGAQAKALGSAPPPVLWQYVLFSLGVFASPLIRQYRMSGHWPDSASGLIGAGVFSLVTGFIVFPKVLDTIAGTNVSTFARLSALFTAGIGWEQVSGLPTALIGK